MAYLSARYAALLDIGWYFGSRPAVVLAHRWVFFPLSPKFSIKKKKVGAAILGPSSPLRPLIRVLCALSPVTLTVAPSGRFQNTQAGVG